MANGPIARLLVELAASTARFQEDLGRAASVAEANSRRIGVAMTFVKSTIAGALGGISIAGFVNVIRASIDAADHLQDLSQRTGVAVETLGGIGFAAKQAGTDLDATATAIGKLNLRIAEAAAGGRQSLEPFE